MGKKGERSSRQTEETEGCNEKQFKSLQWLNSCNKKNWLKMLQ
jgi:hypothetical protein